MSTDSRRELSIAPFEEAGSPPIERRKRFDVGVMVRTIVAETIWQSLGVRDDTRDITAEQQLILDLGLTKIRILEELCPQIEAEMLATGRVIHLRQVVHLIPSLRNCTGNWDVKVGTLIMLCEAACTDY